MKISVIIPTFNEEKVIGACLASLSAQIKKDCEITVIDDGSTDGTKKIVQGYPVKLLEQPHKGAGEARNYGAREAKGQILVFVDADMVFAPQFLERLVKPITEGKTVGTFSKEEYVLNKNNIWSRCWNLNRGLPVDRMHPRNYPDRQPVFRAILKEEFIKAGGFKPVGYIDDHTLADFVGQYAMAAPGAVFYHRNPENLKEVFQQARWIGKSEYKRRKINNENLMRLIALARYSLPMSLTLGVIGVIKWAREVGGAYLIFKIVYDLGVKISLLKSFWGEQRYR